MKYKHTREDYQAAVSSSLSISQVCRNLGIVAVGGNHATVKNNIKRWNIDTSHFTGKGWNVGLKFRPRESFTIDKVLVKDIKYSSSRLKKRLISLGFKEHICEECKNCEWLGNPIPLELHHVDGNSLNNEIENLKLLCPNCHAQTDNYRGKKLKGRVM